MPSHASDTTTSQQPEIGQTSVACPAPLTPPPESHGDPELGRAVIQLRSVGEDALSRLSVGNNTASGMSLMQEESMYTNSDAFEEKMHTDLPDVSPVVSNIADGPVFEDRSQMTASAPPDEYGTTPMFDVPQDPEKVSMSIDQAIARRTPTGDEDEDAEEDSNTAPPHLEPSTDDQARSFSSAIENQAGITPIDQELDWSSDLREWDFSRRRLRPQYPSATFQPYSKFKGTQQSDRQIYNVEVTILTVDIEQCSMSGYLQICGLTPDHPTLTTFFTGEIIGGPDQKYSFRTRTPAWGASDKTDLTHWARFPAWRPLSLHAKRNIDFVYPMNLENWWQQEYVFMRWKEHFLVPDYKLKSIQGASFEGFYYICFNQIEGRVSGIYFHSKSEKYQQLELKHEGQPGVWGMGVCPSIEFR